MPYPLDRALLDEIAALAEAAGREIMAIYATDFDVETKSDASPLTAADMAAHRTICAGLERIDAAVPVLSEESADGIDWPTRREWACHWLVDPLDGTKEFIKKNGEFTVNIAFIEDGVATLGVVHVPARGETYLAARGVGAFKRDAGSERPIAVQQPAARPLRVAGSRSHGNEQTRAFIARLGDTEVVSIGSALKLCLVAEGTVDVYPRFGPTSEWDTAAAQCVVEQAGGRVMDLQLEPLRYNGRDSLLNPFFIVYGDASIDWARYLA